MAIGRLSATVALARRAADAGLRVVVTSCLDGAVAEAAVLAVARACPPQALAGVGLDRRLVLRNRLEERRAAGDALPNPLAMSARDRPEHPALVCDGRTLTYAQLAAETAQTAHWLQGLGVQRASRVAIVAPVGLDLARVFHAVGWLGAVAMPLDPAAPLTDRAAALGILVPDLVVAAVGLAVPAGAWRQEVLNLPFVSQAPRAPAPLPVAWSLDSVRVCLLTSGSSGAPKPVELTTSQLLFSTMGGAIRLGHLPADRWLACLPMHHVGGLAILWRAAWLGITAVVHCRFDAARVAQVLDSGDVSLVSLVPTQLARVLALRPSQPFPQSLRAVLLGGAAAPSSLLADCRKLGVPVARSWGMTETGSQVATSAPFDDAPGLPLLPFAEASVAPDGRVSLSGPLAGSAGVRTADRGEVDATGRIHIQGRIDDVILRGGENISPAAIEAALLQHPAVAEALVVGCVDADLGQVPVAAVVLRAPVEPAVLREWLAAWLPATHVPRRISVLRELPRSSLGKVLRGRVRQILEQAEAIEPSPQPLRHGARPEAGQVDEGVDVADAGTQLAVQVRDVERELDGPLAELRHADGDAQAIAQAHGRAEVGLGVDQRHAPAFALEDVQLPAGAEQFLEGFVAVLEGAREERDARTVDVLETDREFVREHGGKTPLNVR